jgi:hypothetical protein
MLNKYYTALFDFKEYILYCLQVNNFWVDCVLLIDTISRDKI